MSDQPNRRPVRTTPIEGAPQPAGAGTEGTPGDGPAVLHKKKRRRKRRRDSGPPLVSALSYPLLGMGPVVLACYAVLLWMVVNIGFPIAQMIAVLLISAAVGLMFLEIASFTLEGIPSAVRFFELSWESFSVGMFAMVAVLISRLPHLIGVYAMHTTGLASPVMELLLIALGMYYLPMAIIVLADAESERGLNPLLVVRGIAQMPGAYLGLVTLAAAAYLAPALLMHVFQAHPLVRDLLTPLLMLYVAAVLIRAVALLYRRRGVRLAAEDQRRFCERRGGGAGAGRGGSA